MTFFKAKEDAEQEAAMNSEEEFRIPLDDAAFEKAAQDAAR